MTPAGAGKATGSMIHHQRFPAKFWQQNPQVVLANRGKGRPGKPVKRQSRPHATGNQLTGGTFGKRTENTELLQP